MGRMAAAAGLMVVVLSAAGQSAPKQAVTTIELPPAPRAILPDAFDGWVQTKKPVLTTDPAQADAPSAAALKEYSFISAEAANYKRDADETLTMKALRFADTSGAYGAYSFYRQNGWPKEDIGTGGTSFHNRVLFWKGDTVVDATFSKVEPMTAGALREVAAKLPDLKGRNGMAPPVLAFLPQANIDHQTTHYAEGPAGYTGGGGVLPASLVDFTKGAETATANYSLNSGPATLTVIDYPTPQIAEAKEKEIRAYLQAGGNAQPPWPQALKDSDLASLEVRHTGELVVVVSGDAIPDEAHRLIETVHYEATLTKIPQSVESEIQKTSKLLVGIAGIVIVGSLAAILLGFFLGGGRALWRMARGKPISSVYDEEFIHLDLRTKWNDEDEGDERRNPRG
jgi:hypothetical protein